MASDSTLVAFAGLVWASLFDALRIFTLLIWGALVVRLSKPAARNLTHHIRQHDFLYLAIWGTSVSRVWLWVHDAEFKKPVGSWMEYESALGWYVLAIIVGYCFHIVRSIYGDGEPKS